MKTKEKWINETMESLDGIKSAMSDPFIHEKVMERLNQDNTSPIALPPRLFWQIAAGLALLISLNIFSLLSYTTSSTTDQTPVKTLATEYFSYMETIKL